MQLQTRVSISIAGLPDEESERDDQNSDNQHPVLGFDAEKAEWLNEKLQSPRPFSVQAKGFADKKLLILYLRDNLCVERGCASQNGNQSSRDDRRQGSGQAGSLSNSEGG
jgi:hypothetical protein